MITDQATSQQSSVPMTDTIEGAQTSYPSQEKKEGEEKPEDIEFGKKFAALSRKERQLLNREKALSEKEKIYAQRDKTEGEKEAEFKAYLEKKTQFKSNPKALLDAYGLTYQQITDAVLQEDEPLTAERRVEMLEERLEREAKERQEQAEQKRQEEIAEAEAHIKRGIEDHLESNPDKYELISFHQSQDLVYDVMAEYYRLEGKPLSYEAACDEVEKHHEETFKKAQALKKFQRQPQEPQVESPQQDMAPSAPRQETRHVRTLTNENVASAPPVSRGPLLSDEESKRRSARLLEEAWARQKAAAKK